jgi:hypothetical protein
MVKPMKENGTNIRRSVPDVAELGALADELQLRLFPGQTAQLAVNVSEPCELGWEISQIGGGAQLAAGGGTQLISLTLPATARPHSLIRGRVTIRRANGTPLRTVPVAGWVRLPKTGRALRGGDSLFPWCWLRWSLVVLAVAALASGAWRHFQSPTLIISPARIDAGTLLYSPPDDGGVTNDMVFTVRWRVPPRDASDVMLVGVKKLHFVGEASSGNASDETYSMLLTNEINEMHIPLGVHNLVNEIVHVDGAIYFSISNAPGNASAEIRPGQVPFVAQFKPADR